MSDSRYLETACASDLNVAFLMGFAIELGATLIDTWMGRQTLSKQSVADELIKLSTGSLMIVLGKIGVGTYVLILTGSRTATLCFTSDLGVVVLY